MTVRNPYRKSESAISRRAAWSLILCVILPPLGLLYMWRLGVFRMRGRIIVTVFSVLIMTLIVYTGFFGLSGATSMPDKVSPMPVAYAALVTASPDDATLNALSNIDDIIAANLGDAKITPEPTVKITQQEELAQKEAILNTIVYSVYEGAKYYHKSTVCGEQSNRRELTIAKATKEGLGACPICKPPVP